MSDDKIAEIRARHARAELSDMFEFWTDAPADRAFLLAEVEKLRAENEQLRSELDLMKSGFEIAYRALGDKP